jgi:hypothetical protein
MSKPLHRYSRLVSLLLRSWAPWKYTRNKYHQTMQILKGRQVLLRSGLVSRFIVTYILRLGLTSLSVSCLGFFAHLVDALEVVQRGGEIPVALFQ